ncbi:6-phosphogluconate dehydrogenase [Lineolata rhizophorae]|uniref:6-phosphogluconate dehydrogenase, decarboxylating n=1 Tax=Lineolata rhizophorae TaxID=578093 RepID=A0A6A6NZW1_9PEZI|nr:6-phosphogluconate dehydrogenase [Lineolata rhizophorae]
MSLLFAELGVEVNVYDPSQENVQKLLERAKNAGLSSKIKDHSGYESICKALGTRKVFIFSVPHGDVGDKTVDGLRPFLEPGDVIVDASNEHWRNTERRQKRLEPDAIHYVGMGVSGGYQSARHGPSMSPSGSDIGLDTVLPFLTKACARDVHGKPCIAKVGPGGSGHYVKMVHNGIEQGMMSTICEVWGIMNKCLGMDYEEVATIFEQWNDRGPLKRNFLVSIGAHICRTRDPKDGSYVLADILDKVVQDVDETEGTGVWTCEEGARLHVPIPTIAAAHLFRVGSADAAKRMAVQRAFGSRTQPGSLQLNGEEKSRFINTLHEATVVSFFLAYIQGLHLIAKASEEQKWNINFRSVMQLWRGGCIIQSDNITDVFDKAYASDTVDTGNLLAHELISHELSSRYSALKDVTLRAMGVDAPVPSLSASLEYYKYMSSTDLPIQFMEAQLDYFGEHMYDLKSETPGKPVTGKHHFEWKPARGIHET